MRNRPPRALPTRWTRVLCGSLAAGFATFVAAFSHVLAGGTTPSAAAVMLSLALSILICVALAGRSMSLWRTTAGVAVSQGLFHGLFSQISSSGTVVMSEHAGHNGVGLGTIDAGLAASTSHSASMWFAHAVAAVLTVVALRYTESAVTGLRASAGLFLASLTTAPTAVPFVAARRAPRIGCSQTVLVRDLTLLFSALRHRGPPAQIAA